jgi:hypothetical protein
MVGPFIFFDQMGPVQLITGQNLDVRPHPHIRLATVTYLFEFLRRGFVAAETLCWLIISIKMMDLTSDRATTSSRDVLL